MLARKTASILLKEWLKNNDEDLREREDESRNISGSGLVTNKKTRCIGSDSLDSLERKRLYVKLSIDHALNTLKAHAYSDNYSHMLVDTPSKWQLSSGEPVHSLGDYTFYPTTDADADNDSSSRQLLLPYIYGDSPVLSSSKRPRSAGQDIEPEPLRVPISQHKLESKYSFLNVFCKASDIPNAVHMTRFSLQRFVHLPRSASPSPAPGTIPLPSSPRFNLAHCLPSLPPESPLVNRRRLLPESDTGLGTTGFSATNFHDSLAEYVTSRSGSRRVFDEDYRAEGSG
jgi:hypothetical protein